MRQATRLRRQSGYIISLTRTMATTESFEEGDVPSPCINVCRLDETGWLCLGCHRTLDEIAGWSGYTPAQKQTVLEQLSARKASA